jgi:hypothetical protein
MKPIVKLLIVALAAVGLGYCLAQPYITGVILASDHQNVASKISIKDNTRGTYLQLKCEGVAMKPILPFETAFPSGHEYKTTKWAFYEPNTGNLEAYMILSGPGVDGKTYGVEIVRLGWNEYAVQTPKGNFVFPKITAGETVSPGYVALEFIP